MVAEFTAAKSGARAVQIHMERSLHFSSGEQYLTFFLSTLPAAKASSKWLTPRLAY